MEDITSWLTINYLLYINILQIDRVCFKQGENTETGQFRKKPQNKIDYNLFAGDKIEELILLHEQV